VTASLCTTASLRGELCSTALRSSAVVIHAAYFEVSEAVAPPECCNALRRKDHGLRTVALEVTLIPSTSAKTGQSDLPCSGPSPSPRRDLIPGSKPTRVQLVAGRSTPALPAGCRVGQASADGREHWQLRLGMRLNGSEPCYGSSPFCRPSRSRTSARSLLVSSIAMSFAVRSSKATASNASRTAAAGNAASSPRPLPRRAGCLRASAQRRCQ
jgi:hypothetical protein